MPPNLFSLVVIFLFMNFSRIGIPANFFSLAFIFLLRNSPTIPIHPNLSLCLLHSCLSYSLGIGIPINVG